MLYAQLRAFHAVASEGGFSKAAAALNVTQPAVSAQVKALEETYGVRLFERRPRGISLTDPGQRLFEIARRIFRLEQEAHEALRSVHGAPPAIFRIGSDAPYSVSRLLALYCQAQPGLQVSLTMGTAEELRRELLGGRIDVAVLVRVTPVPELVVLPNARHRIMVAVASTHPWAKRRGIRLAELGGQPMVLRDTRHSLTSQVFETTLLQAGIEPRIAMKVDSRENLREAVAAGLGIGVAVDADAVSDVRVRLLPVVDANMSIPDYVVCLKQRSGISAIRAFLDLARRQAGEADGAAPEPELFPARRVRARAPNQATEACVAGRDRSGR